MSRKEEGERVNHGTVTISWFGITTTQRLRVAGRDNHNHHVRAVRGGGREGNKEQDEEQNNKISLRINLPPDSVYRHRYCSGPAAAAEETKMQQSSRWDDIGLWSEDMMNGIEHGPKWGSWFLGCVVAFPFARKWRGGKDQEVGILKGFYSKREAAAAQGKG